MQSLVVAGSYVGHQGPFRPFRVTGTSPPVILSPKVEPADFGSLQAAHPLPLIVRISKADACAAYRDMRLYARTDRSRTDAQTDQPRISITVK